MAADVADQLYTGVVAHQHFRVIQQFQRIVVAMVRRHEFVADVVRPAAEQILLLEFMDIRIEVPRNRKLRGWRCEL